jgi:hypothetical protein
MSVGLDIMYEYLAEQREVIRHMSEERHFDADDSLLGQDATLDHDALLDAQTLLDQDDVPVWFDDEIVTGYAADIDTGETDEAEYAAWLRGLPNEVRADYLARPWAGPIETDPAGFWHHDIEPDSAGIGFAAGGPLDELVPGPDLAGFAAASDANRAELGESALIGVLCAWQRLAAWAQVGQAAALMTLARRREAQALDLKRPSLAEHVNDEVAAALRLTARSANRLLDTAGGLDRLPDVHAALKRGEIDWPKASLFPDLLAGLPDDAARDIAASLLERASGMTSGQLRAALTRAALAHDPEAAERRREEARTDSGVHTWTETSGNAAMAGRELATSDVIHANARLTACAGWLRENGATETMDQLRAAVYIALLTGRPVASLLPPSAADDATPKPDTPSPDSTQATDSTPTVDFSPTPDLTPTPNAAPAASSPQPSAAGAALTGSINLTMPMSAWLGLTREPGEVASVGPIDAQTCRQLAAVMDSASRWCLTLTDPAGHAVAHACASNGPPPRQGRPPPQGGSPADGPKWAAALVRRLQVLETSPCLHIRRSTGYKPSRSLRHLVVLRQRRCSFPGCRRPAGRSDLDHTTPFDQGGLTCECNLAPLCRRHHQAKQAHGWSLTQPEPGRMIWRLPHERSYETGSEPYPV